MKGTSTISFFMWKDRTRVKSESGRSAAALTSFRPFGISDEKGYGRGERRSGMDRPAAAVFVCLLRDVGGPSKETADFLLQTRRIVVAELGRGGEAARIMLKAADAQGRFGCDHQRQPL